jgi:hypothetical protein
MQVLAYIYFSFYDQNSKHQVDAVDAVLKRHGIHYEPIVRVGLKGNIRITYELKIDYEPLFIERLVNDLRFVVDRDLDFGFRFVFSEDEYEQSPLYELISIGYDRRLYLENKGSYQTKHFCDTCGKQTIEQEEPLLINTAIFEKSNIVFVDQELVISEKMAELFNNWGLTGYRLEQVNHYGSPKNKRTAYQIVPTNILPPQNLPDSYLNDPVVNKLKCPTCRTGGHLFYPHHYNEAVLDRIQDFNFAHEYRARGPYEVRRVLLISSNVRKRLIENGIANDEWDYRPVIII